MPRAVRFGGLHEPLDLLLGEIFAAALANCYIYNVGDCSRSRAFSTEIALPPVPTVTNWLTCNSARALTIENAEGSTRPRFCALRSISNCPLRTRREGEQSLAQPPRVFWGLC